MEHDDRFGGFMKRDDSSSDPEQDFESYLRRKAEACQDVPLSQQKQTPVPSQKELLEKFPGLNVRAVAERSSNDGGSPTVASVSESTSGSASGVASASEQLEVHAIRGVDGQKYVTVTTEPIAKNIVNEKWLELYHKTRQNGLNMKDPEAVIRHRDRLDRLRFLIPAMQNGLDAALEELLKAENATERARLIEIRSQLKRTQNAKSTTEAKPKRASSKPVSDRKKGKTKAMIAVDTMMGLKFSRAKIEANLTELGVLDGECKLYIEGLFSVAGGAK